jgi:hypothetical protein
LQGKNGAMVLIWRSLSPSLGGALGCLPHRADSTGNPFSFSSLFGCKKKKRPAHQSTEIISNTTRPSHFLVDDTPSPTPTNSTLKSIPSTQPPSYRHDTSHLKKPKLQDITKKPHRPKQHTILLPLSLSHFPSTPGPIPIHPTRYLVQNQKAAPHRTATPPTSTYPTQPALNSNRSACTSHPLNKRRAGTRRL